MFNFPGNTGKLMIYVSLISVYFPVFPGTKTNNLLDRYSLPPIDIRNFGANDYCIYKLFINMFTRTQANPRK